MVQRKKKKIGRVGFIPTRPAVLTPIRMPAIESDGGEGGRLGRGAREGWLGRGGAGHVGQERA